MAEPLPGVQVIQFFQKASVFDIFQRGGVIVQIVADCVLGNFHKKTGEVVGSIYFTKAVAECLLNIGKVSLLHLPDLNFPSRPAVGIGKVKHIAKFVWNIPVYQQGNASGSLVDPPAKFIPGVDLGAGSCIRPLCVDQ